MAIIFTTRKSTIFYMLLSMQFLSCTEKTEKLEISLTNKFVNCVGNINYNNLYRGNVAYDSLYNSLSRTVIRYNIHNPTRYKYFVVFDPSFFENYDEMFSGSESQIKNISTNHVSLNLYSDYRVSGNYSDAHNGNEFLHTKAFYDYILYADTLNLYKFKAGFGINDIYTSSRLSYILRNHIVIYPGETKYFTSIINLPLRDYRLGLSPWNTVIEKGRKYQAGLTLFNSRQEIEKFLTPDLKKEIKENGYIIFNGVIQSNRIPVEIVAIKDNIQ